MDAKPNTRYADTAIMISASVYYQAIERLHIAKNRGEMNDGPTAATVVGQVIEMLMEAGERAK